MIYQIDFNIEVVDDELRKYPWFIPASTVIVNNSPAECDHIGVFVLSVMSYRRKALAPSLNI